MTDAPPSSNFVRSLTQAMGMVSAQVACSLDEAFALICDRAEVRHCSVYEIAIAVVDHSIRFDDAYSN